MKLPYDEDQLRELELWPLVSLTRGGLPVAAPAVTEADPPRAPAAEPPVPMARREPVTPARREPIPIQADPGRDARIAAAGWGELVAEANACTTCVLCRQRKQAVVGVGAIAGPWLFVGEGPGAEEDERGEPFVGQAGRLLDAMLAAAGLARGRDVYIANTVKCRPPGNRTPADDEAKACAPFLDRQIDLIRPRLIVALGKTAATRLTGAEGSMASMRGKVHRYRDIPVVATYHPAYLLRNLPDKRLAWEDLMLAKRAFVEAPG